MKKTKKLAVLLFLTMIATVLWANPHKAALLSSTTDAVPSVDQILDKYVEALGGKAAIQKVTSRVSKGTAEIVGLETKGTIEIYEKAPDKLTRIVKIPGAFAWASGFNGTMAWAFNMSSGKLEEKKGKDLTVAKTEAEFYQVLKLKEHYATMAVKGVEQIQYRNGPRATYVIEATATTGDPEKLYFDTENGLLIRHDTVEVSDEGKVPIREFLLDYTDVDGVKIPFTSRQAQGRTVLLFKLTDVKQNLGIDDGRFNKPAVR
jgi:outer membrane lipoprotein-sorting protein